MLILTLFAKNGKDVNYSAVQYVKAQLGLQVTSIARLMDLLDYLSLQKSDSTEQATFKTTYDAVLAYRQRYGVDGE